MKSIRVRSIVACGWVSMALMGAVACTSAPEESLEGEGELVDTVEQALPTDGQVCVTVQRGTSGQVEDATLWQSASIWNDGANERISTGTSAAGGYSRSLIRFDLGAVPAGATVVSADLTLMQNYKNGASASIDVLRVTGGWSEGTVTWDNFAGAVDPSPVASFTAVGNGGFGARTVDVRDLAQDWVSGAAANHGVAIDSPTDTTRSEFRSSESPALGERPALSLCYTTCNDGVQNGEETDVDCGGSYCDACEEPLPSGSFYYSASNTSSANQNTTNVPVALPGGATFVVGTCGLPDASAIGDTYLRLFDANGQQVAASDDACGSLSSNISYTVPANAGGTYTIRAGCYSSLSCSGTVAYTAY